MSVHSTFSNTGRLVKFTIKRERVMSPVWLICLILFSVSLAGGMSTMFDSNARIALAETLKNPGMIAMMGPVYGADNYTVGAMYSNTMFLWVAIAVAAMNIFLVVRHTRGDEEKGRSEVIRSLPTGRLATLNSTMITALMVDIILAVITGLGIAVQGVEAMGFGASMLYGAALGVMGFFFAAVAAVFSQLSASSRSAIGYSFIALCVLYVIRAAGDVGSEVLSLICPMGLIQRSQLFVENNVWPVAVVFVESLAVLVVAYALNAIRDIEQGFIHAKPGKSGASLKMRTPVGFALRLLRNTVIAWVVIMFMLAASYGSILGDIESFVEQSQFYQMVIGSNANYSILEMFVATVNTIGALVAVVPLLIIALRLRNEEREGRAENILGRGVSRTKYMAGFAATAFISAVLMQLASALGLYVSSYAVLDKPISMGYLLEANLVYLPALWIMIGAAVLLSGVLPKLSGLVWAYFAFSFFTEFMGRMLNLPAWLPKLSPYGYVPQLPVDEVRALPLIAMTAVAAVLTAAGFVLYKKRDMVN